MALLANPSYGTAQANLGDVQLLMALRAYREAGRLGVPGMQGKAGALEALIKGTHPQ